jgi:hypothetical protein
MDKFVAVSPRVIGFRTSSDWTVADLSGLLSACSQAYNVFDALVTFRGHDERSLHFYQNIVETIQPYLSDSEEGKLYLQLYKQWLEVYQKYLEKGLASSLTELEHPPIPHHSVVFDFSSFSYSLGSLYSRNQQFSSLRIHRIKMASPGGISFAGLAEVMKELREFFKDIWFRNKQEKTMGQLEIIEKYVSVLIDINKLNDSQKQLATDLPSLCRTLDESVSQLRQLESRKLLADVSENIDYITER